MINLLIVFLQKLQGKSSNQTSSPSAQYVPLILTMLMYIGVIGFELSQILGSGMTIVMEEWFAPWVYVVMIILQTLGFISLFSQKASIKEGKGISAYTVYIPLLFVTTALAFHIGSNIQSLLTGFSRLQVVLTFIGGSYGTLSYVLLLFILIYPITSIIDLLVPTLKDKRIWNKIVSLAMLYNLGYFFFFSIILSGFVFFKTSVWTESINDPLGFLIFIAYLFIFTYPLISFKNYYVKAGSNRANILGGVIALGIPFICLIALPVFSQRFFERQITKSQNIMQEGGDNYYTYKKSQTLFLESAYLKKFKRDGNLSDPYFSKLYDSTPEAYFGDRLTGVNLKSQNSFGTDDSKIGDNANVQLTLIEIENNIISSQGNIDVMKTTYTLHMANKINTNQEVVIDFETPSKYSVVSDLALGLNSELIGIIAPRGAAAQVYANSLKINTDPALIEKTGPQSYTLRVFPVPAKTDSVTQGRQLVKVAIITPLQVGIPTIYSPKLSALNLRIDKDTSLVSKIYTNNTLTKEDVIQNNNIKTYLAQDHILPEDVSSKISSVPLHTYCIANDIAASTLNLAGSPVPIISTGGLTQVSSSTGLSGSTASIIKKGMTWKVLEMREKEGIVLVGSDSLSNPYNGDTNIEESLPLLCVRKSAISEKKPSSLVINEGYGWGAGEAKLSRQHKGSEITSKQNADSICQKDLGAGWQFGEFHFATEYGGGNWYAYGSIPVNSGRFWVGINDQIANPWGARNADTSYDESIVNTIPQETYYKPEPLTTKIDGIDSGNINTYMQTLFATKKQTKNKISIFFDNSVSIKRNHAQDMYGDIYKQIKNFNGKIQDVDIYSSNFSVEKIATLNDISYRGYSDIDGLIDYIEKNKLINQRIIFVTDDDTFNISITENANRNLGQLVSNQIDVIKIGVGVKTYKSDFVSLISATQGNIYNLNDIRGLDSIIQSIFADSQSLPTQCDSTINATQNTDIQKILAGYVSSKLLALVKNNNDRSTIANIQTTIATRYHIVNQFNSMIALQNDSQKQELERYQKIGTKYDIMYNNMGGGSINITQTPNRLYGDDIGRVGSSRSSYDGGNPRFSSFMNQTNGVNMPGVEYSDPYYSPRDYAGPINANIITILLIAIIYIVQIYQCILSIYMIRTGKDHFSLDPPAQLDPTESPPTS